METIKVITTSLVFTSLSFRFYIEEFGTGLSVTTVGIHSTRVSGGYSFPTIVLTKYIAAPAYNRERCKYLSCATSQNVRNSFGADSNISLNMLLHLCILY